MDQINYFQNVGTKLNMTQKYKDKNSIFVKLKFAVTDCYKGKPRFYFLDSLWREQLHPPQLFLYPFYPSSFSFQVVQKEKCEQEEELGGRGWIATSGVDPLACDSRCLRRLVSFLRWSTIVLGMSAVSWSALI